MSNDPTKQWYKENSTICPDKGKKMCCFLYRLDFYSAVWNALNLFSALYYRIAKNSLIILAKCQEGSNIKMNLYKATAIIVAAGTGSRMKVSVNKQYLMLSGKPVLARTIEAFEKSEFISEIIVVINREDHKQFEDCILIPFKFLKITSVVDGGTDRQGSVYNGLKKVPSDTEIVCVHDGARPFVTQDNIKESVMAARKLGAACTGVPVKDTIKQADECGIVEKTLDRRLLWAIQTPQAFKREVLINAHEKAILDGFRGTDDCVLVERLGLSVQMVMGSYSNIKITTPEDLVFAEAIGKERILPELF